ncbi:MAG: glycosyltransferase family 4 protein [Actinomycetota bacterium]|nr:glycosyltransferase family 4 protein [Actinomycetota bacterium]
MSPSSRRLRLLVCADTSPWPPDRGDRLRYAHFVETLRDGHDVRLLVVRREREARERPLEDADEVRLSPGRVALNALRGLASPVPVQFSAFGGPAARRAVRAAAGGCDAFVALGARAGLLRAALPPGLPSILDLQDGLVLNARAQWRGARGVLRKVYGADNLLKAGAFERRLARRFDLVLVAGNADLAWVRSRYPDSPSALVPTAVPVPDAPSGPPSAPRLLFLGDLRFAPNVDAVRFLVAEVWPRVRSRCPRAVLQVVGHEPARNLAAWLRARGIETAYSVPDVAPYMEAARVFVAPMRIGSGVKVKVLQAMAAARPVAMTRLANDGIGATSGTDALVEDSSDALASAIVALLEDDDLARRMGFAARELVEREFSSGAVAAKLRAAIDPVLAERLAPAP